MHNVFNVMINKAFLQGGNYWLTKKKIIRGLYLHDPFHFHFIMSTVVHKYSEIRSDEEASSHKTSKKFTF